MFRIPKMIIDLSDNETRAKLHAPSEPSKRKSADG